MNYQLVIAEKPSVARSIAGVIGATEKHDGYLQGNGYLVSWCIGHLVSFADAGRYDERFKKWRYEDLPILPETWQYIIPNEKKQQFDILRSLMERPDVIGLVCATDAGREGELIFRFVYQMAGCKKPFKRLWISSMEDSAIRDGFAHLKPGTDYDPLYQSALCRAKADWLVGINATRLFSVLYHKTLTVGRVQTPTLNLLVERDAKITNFKKEKYHIVHIGVDGADAVSRRISDAGEANTVKAACAGAQAVCASVTREKKTEQPPKLYDLTTLQREANRLFGFTAKQTLDYAQTLYEKKLLTYPRTDSQYLTDDML
ncbi:MAG: DNA topoisomerase, partial [Candidatus Limivicinus sp.]